MARKSALHRTLGLDQSCDRGEEPPDTRSLCVEAALEEQSRQTGENHRRSCRGQAACVQVSAAVLKERERC
jgi:hypothetical protein